MSKGADAPLLITKKRWRKEWSGFVLLYFLIQQWFHSWKARINWRKRLHRPIEDLISVWAMASLIGVQLRLLPRIIPVIWSYNLPNVLGPLYERSALVLFACDCCNLTQCQPLLEMHHIYPVVLLKEHGAVEACERWLSFHLLLYDVICSLKCLGSVFQPH